MFLIYIDDLYNLLILLFFSFKIGVFPFHFWMFQLGPYMRAFSFSLFLSFHKFLLMGLILFHFGLLIFLILLFNLLFGSLKIMDNSERKIFFIASSLYVTIWVSLVYLERFASWFLLFSFYLLLIYLCFSHLWRSVFILVSATLFFSSFPPLGLFFIKFISIKFFFDNFLSTQIAVFWVFTFLATCFYFLFFLRGFLSRLVLFAKKPLPLPSFVFYISLHSLFFV